MQKFSRGKTACPKILEWRMENILGCPNFLDIRLQTPNVLLSKSSMETVQKPDDRSRQDFNPRSSHAEKHSENYSTHSDEKHDPNGPIDTKSYAIEHVEANAIIKNEKPSGSPDIGQSIKMLEELHILRRKVKQTEFRI